MSLYTLLEFPLTSVFHKEATQKSANLPLLVFIPGNPGLIDYYVTYLSIIAEKYPKYDILAISHAGYQTSDDFIAAGKDPKEKDYYDLEYQVEHKVAILKKHLSSRKEKTDVSFLCHSMGSFIVQRVVKAIVDDPELSKRVNVKFTGLICPTIVDIAKSLLGVMFTRLFSYLPLVYIALFFCAFLRAVLPVSWVKYIIKTHIIAQPVLKDAVLLEAWKNSIEATYKILQSSRIVVQTLTMAQEELRLIRRDDEINDWFFQELPKLGTRIWSFFAAHDYWVHESSRDYILTRYHDIENRNVQFEIGKETSETSKAIDHSFCIDQSVEFAEVTCLALSNL